MKIGISSVGVPLLRRIGSDGGKFHAQESITIGIISDTHLRKSPRVEFTALADQRQRYREFVNAMNNDVQPDFVVHQGDMMDGVKAGGELYETPTDEDTAIYRIRLAKQALHQQLEMPIYNILGNHEQYDPNWEKARIRQAINPNWKQLSDTWYNFTYKGYEFIFLNTGYTDTRIADHTAPLEEVEWLRNTLAETDRPTFVFMHVPVTQGADMAYDQFGNQNRVKNHLANHEHFVAGFFGHVHHEDSWDRLRLQKHEFGNPYYHTSQPHQWMGDEAQIPWAVLKITPGKLTFAVGSGVDDPQEYPTIWRQTF